MVEDDQIVLQMVAKMLSRLGYFVLEANTPAEAISLVKQSASKIDLVLTDVIMPEINGQALAELLGMIEPGLSFLFMSGYTANILDHHEIMDEKVRFIQKPFTKKELAEKIQDALKNDKVYASPGLQKNS